MTTQNNTTTIRAVIPKLMYNISILYQNGEITMDEKNRLCQAAKQALTDNDTSGLYKQFKSMRYGSMFPNIIDECIQLIAN